MGTYRYVDVPVLTLHGSVGCFAFFFNVKYTYIHSYIYICTTQAAPQNIQHQVHKTISSNPLLLGTVLYNLSCNYKLIACLATKMKDQEE